jgi:hypothetical protein
MCIICTNSYNNLIKRIKIKCNICGEECCKSCVEEYLFKSYVDVHCMFCKNIWDYRFIYENMNNTFLNKLKYQQSKMLLDREKMLLPETQKYIEYDKTILLMEKQIKFNHSETTKLNNTITMIEEELPLKNCPNALCNAKYVFHKDKYCYKCKQNICVLCRSIMYSNHKCDERRKQKVNLYLEYIKQKIELFHKTETMKYKVYKWHHDYTTDKNILEYEHNVICVCPENICKGYITSKEYKCNLCNTTICKRCYNKWDETHVCDINDIKTVDMLKSSTKPCPKCASLIHKIDGCNQMWCTHCNTAFGWLTGKIEKGAVHNPHYFEWFNNIDKTTDTTEYDNRTCEGIPEQRYFLTHISLTIKRIDLHIYNVIILYFRILLHINDICLSEDDNEHDKVKQNLDLRMQWIYNEIDDKRWGSLLYQRYKKSNIKKTKREIFSMFVIVSSDICYKILACSDHILIRQYTNEWDNILNYTNTCFSKLRNVFNLQMPLIKVDDSYNFNIKMKHNY